MKDYGKIRGNRGGGITDAVTAAKVDLHMCTYVYSGTTRITKSSGSGLADTFLRESEVNKQPQNSKQSKKPRFRETLRGFHCQHTKK